MTIERMMISRSDVEPDPRADLAKDASHFLGYHKLANVTLKKATLANALVKLDIAPLNRISVEQYKAKKSRPGMWSDVKRGLCLASVLPFALTVFVAFVFKASAVPTSDTALSILLVIGSVICGLGSLVLIISSLIHLLDSGHSGAHRIAREWKSIRLDSYDGAVPEFVLSKAIDIKREIDGVTFSVEQLFETEGRIERRHIDPFLVAKLNNESFYIDVWDEKEYESKL